MTHTSMRSLDRHIWQSRIRTSTKLKLYNIYILPVLLYGSECWTVTKADARRIDAVDQWCLRRILDVCWFDFVRNDQSCQITQQPPLSVIVKSRHPSLIGHVARMDTTADASRIIFEQPAENWRSLRSTFSSFNMTGRQSVSYGRCMTC